MATFSTTISAWDSQWASSLSVTRFRPHDWPERRNSLHSLQISRLCTWFLRACASLDHLGMCHRDLWQNGQSLCNWFNHLSPFCKICSSINPSWTKFRFCKLTVNSGRPETKEKSCRIQWILDPLLAWHLWNSFWSILHMTDMHNDSKIMVIRIMTVLWWSDSYYQHYCFTQSDYWQAGAAAAIVGGHQLLGAVMFCLALNHKQMALYYAPAFFAHLLGTCLQKPSLMHKVHSHFRFYQNCQTSF